MRHLVIMSGIPGSGKSTYIKNNYKGYQVISSDAIRLKITGSYKDFSREPEVWNIVNHLLHHPSKEKVVLDTTALTATRRKNLATNYEWRYKKITLVQMNTPVEVCIARVEKRTEKPISKEEMKYFIENYEPYTTKERGYYNDVRIIDSNAS